MVDALAEQLHGNHDQQIDQHKGHKAQTLITFFVCKGIIDFWMHHDLSLVAAALPLCADVPLRALAYCSRVCLVDAASNVLRVFSGQQSPILSGMHDDNPGAPQSGCATPARTSTLRAAWLQRFMPWWMQAGDGPAWRFWQDGQSSVIGPQMECAAS